MKEAKNILDEISSKGEGMTVPENYFENFALQMAGKLPYREVLDKPEVAAAAPKNSRWMRLRPYVYMAAMFAGAWCLLKMFSLMTADPYDTNINNYPVLSNALENEQFVNDYVIDDLHATEIYDAFYYEEESADTTEMAVDAPQDESEYASPDSYILPTQGYEPEADVTTAE